MRTLHKGFLLIAIPVIAQLLFVFLLLAVYRDSEEQTWRELRYRAKTTSLARMNLMVDKAIGVLVVYGISREQLFLEQYRAIMNQLETELDKLSALISERMDSEAVKQLEQFNKMRTRLEHQMKSFERRAITPTSLPREAQIVEINQARLLNEEFLREVSKLISDGKSLNAPDARSIEQRRSMLFTFIGFGVLANLVIALAVLLIFARQFASKVEILVDNARKLPKNEPLNGRIEGEDELSLLDSVFHDMAKELRENNERREQLTAMVSHDLRTPLLSSHMSVELLQEGAAGILPEQAQALVARLHRSLSRLIGLVNDILDLEKLRAGKMSLQLSTVELSTLVADAISEVQALAADKEIRIEAQGTGVAVVDADRIMQVLVNLLSNAIKFSPEKSTITMNCVQEGEQLQLQIDDQGPGVAPQYREGIFLPYEQSPAGTRASVKGTGLGLPICKFIVDLHGGKIGVEDSPAGGSRFWFTVPAAIIEEL